jgi:hypothetical protein
VSSECGSGHICVRTNGSISTSDPNSPLYFLSDGYGIPPSTVTLSIDTAGSAPSLHVDVVVGQPDKHWDTGPMEQDHVSPTQYHLVAGR